MTAVILAFEIGPSQVVSALVGSVSAVVILLGIFDKRRKDISQTWKDLYEAKAQEVTDLTAHLARVEAKVNLLESEFIDKLAQGITSAIIRMVREEREAKP